MKIKSTILGLLCPFLLIAQPGPEVTSWILNTTGQTGYGGILSNVQQVQYSTGNVYVTATCIPDYSIGPWSNNPNTPVNQNFLFKFTRNPVQNTGNPVVTPLGHIGVWSNGVSIFNAKDGMSYNNQGFWNRDALVFEGISFDNCLGHPAPNGEYHHHVNPTCLYDDTDDTKHAPIIGYAFDGFPIYGAYGYDNANGSGSFRKMESSYRLRNITSRNSLPDGTVLQPSQYGPAIGGQYPLGAFLEDYEYVVGFGDLDEHNGRFCVTPEYPSGIYAYFVTINAVEYPVFPYVIGPTYYGTVQPGNTGPNSGHNTISEPVTNYVPGATIIEEGIVPNSTSAFNSAGMLNVVIGDEFVSDANMQLFDISGRLILSKNGLAIGSHQFEVPEAASGIYFLRISSSNNSLFQKIYF